MEEKNLAGDINSLNISENLKKEISNFIDKECVPMEGSTYNTADLKKIIIEEVKKSLDNSMKYNSGTDIPLWHKLQIAGVYYMENKESDIGYLLAVLSNLVMTTEKGEI